MSSTDKQYWKGIAEKNNNEAVEQSKQDEFDEELPVDELLEDSFLSQKTNRRNFLKFLGFSTTAATVAASCEIPVKKAIPYVVKPEEVVPGKALWYASTYFDGEDYANVLVKTREGRPIKIEGNEKSGINKGGTSARTQASVLELYDSTRLQGPKKDGNNKSWAVIDKEIKDKLSAINDKKGNIALLTRPIASPSTQAVIEKLKKKYSDTTVEKVPYEPYSASAILDAHEKDFGKRALPTYLFHRAKVIVSVGADFLGSWISPVEHARQYGEGRKVSKEKPFMSRHIQFESMMSLTGTNADVRRVIPPHEHTLLLGHLYLEVAKRAGGATLSLPPLTKHKEAVKQTAEELWKNRNRALVVAGTNDVKGQQFVNAINNLLSSYGNTLDIKNHSNLRAGDDAKVQKWIDKMEQGQVDAVLCYGVNPAYDYPDQQKFKKALQNVDLTISFNDRMDETTSLVQYACPDHHYLESWNDTEPRKGFYGITQPTIRPLFNTRQAQASLLAWAGEDQEYRSFIRQYWEDNMFTQQKEYKNFKMFWQDVVQNGMFALKQSVKDQPKYKGDVAAVANKVSKRETTPHLVLYEKVGIGDGRHANNPWLHELPDPVSKITWDNYLMVSRDFAEEKQLTNAIKQSEGLEPTTDVVKVKNEQGETELPVYIHPGLAGNTMAAAIGYGRQKAGKAGNGVGSNMYPFVRQSEGNFRYVVPGVSIKKTGKTHEIAQTQLHHNLHGRPIVKDTTLKEYKEDPYSGNEEYKHHETDKHGHIKEVKETTLYPEREYDGHHWGMSIDLNACIGCSACVIACQAENNIPVVGKEEVKRKHEMHWLRIDRYYSGDEENPEVTHQPMLCQHCDHAPCENVCPVAATNHGSEGLNQMIYNRCVGTKYCMNNCPYKVRRFNWYDYTGTDAFPWNEHIEEGAMSDGLARMVLNPDVTVRSRGVMEKCTFCIQRIQKGKLEAKKENRDVEDGEVQTACQQACPTHAISFGDMNNKDSEVAQEKNDERSYHVLHELHTLPSVSYKTKVRNKEEDEDSNLS